jgi:hypothetical protein
MQVSLKKQLHITKNHKIKLENIYISTLKVLIRKQNNLDLR